MFIFFHLLPTRMQITIHWLHICKCQKWRRMSDFSDRSRRDQFISAENLICAINKHPLPSSRSSAENYKFIFFSDFCEIGTLEWFWCQVNQSVLGILINNKSDWVTLINNKSDQLLLRFPPHCPGTVGSWLWSLISLINWYSRQILANLQRWATNESIEHWCALDYYWLKNEAKNRNGVDNVYVWNWGEGLSLI